MAAFRTPAAARRGLSAAVSCCCCGAAAAAGAPLSWRRPLPRICVAASGCNVEATITFPHHTTEKNFKQFDILFA